MNNYRAVIAVRCTEGEASLRQPCGVKSCRRGVSKGGRLPLQIIYMGIYQMLEDSPYEAGIGGKVGSILRGCDE